MRKYYKRTIKDVVSIKEIYTIDLFLWEKNDCKSYLQSHPFWEFCFVKNGNITYDCDGIKTHLYSGEAFFLPPGTNHIIINDNSVPAELLIINFNTQSNIVSAIKNCRFSVKADFLQYLFAIINEKQFTFDSSSETGKLVVLQNPILGGAQCIEINFELFIIHVIRYLSQTESPVILFREKNDKEFICNQLKTFLKDNLYDKITIDDICKKLHYSRSYLSHIFSETTGKSIISYLNDLKIEQAKKLLITTSMTVVQISDKLSFTEVNYFNHRFKAQTGMTPSEYKKIVFKKQDL